MRTLLSVLAGWVELAKVSWPEDCRDVVSGLCPVAAAELL